MTNLATCTPAPWFAAPTHGRPKFTFSSAAGRWLLLAFLPDDADGRRQMLAAIAANRAQFSDAHIAAFVVCSDPALFAAASEGDGLRWFDDADRTVAKLYGALDEGGACKGLWVLIDPSLRLLGWAQMHDTEAMFRRLPTLPQPDAHAGVPVNAPVLILPRIIEPALCRRLIDFYQEDGGAPSGVMQERDGKTVGVLNDYKKRCDATIPDDSEMRDLLRVRIGRRLLPELRKAFQFTATRIERYIVACYDAEAGGYFRPHRDDTTAGTAHRRFAVSINLNGDFEGGDLRFPEFGSRTYRPPTGGAVVFSCSLLHEATPVTKGTRYAFLPFLYDEAGAKIRAENMHLIEPQPADPVAGPEDATPQAALAQAN